MSPAVSAVLAILGTVLTGMGVYYMARSNARDNERRRLDAQAKAVADAIAPLQRDNDELRQENRELRMRIRDGEIAHREEVRDKEQRIAALLDELRRRA